MKTETQISGNERSQLEKDEAKKYAKEFGAASALFVVTIASLMTFVDEESSTAKYWVLLAAVPFIAGIAAFYRALRRYDEYTRLQHLRGLAAAFGVTLFGVFMMGMFEIVNFATGWWGPWLTFMASMTTWGCVTGFLMARDE